MNSLVTSRLDYGNALLSGASNGTISRLQRVQNTAARLITRAKKCDHITPVLIRLHWLPVAYRVQYKLLLYTYKALHGLAPPYLQELVSPYQPTRTLRSDSAGLFCVPRTRSETYGNKRFDVTAATLWNAIPKDLKCASSLSCFKKGLKTYLFRKAYS